MSLNGIRREWLVPDGWEYVDGSFTKTGGWWRSLVTWQIRNLTTGEVQTRSLNL